ncbi:MAG: UDP-N-acetylmuramate--L-alanine ligase [Clostridia bacterium]|nr:UDP-N-acetylmuramate--L-alanine ligase [Clostridia bacterium]
MSVKNTSYGPELIRGMLADCRRLFFIGIGGISMSALAELSMSEGYLVGGSDRSGGPTVEHLKELGIKVFCEHKAENISSFDAVIYTVAISEDNPEYREAIFRGIPCISRADYMGYLMTAFRERIGVSGMHGKSSCTAMCAEIFLSATDATVLCGAPLPAHGNTSCVIGKAREHFLFEACEYMDSFLDFSPTTAVILNIGMDHVDYFHSMEQVRTSFLRFAEKANRVLYNADDPECQRALAGYPYERHTFGLSPNAEFRAENLSSVKGCYSFDFYRGEDLLCRVSLRVPGRHNVYNALASGGAAILSGLATTEVKTGLEKFLGAGRRMEKKGRLASGAMVYDDYGHHPDEIRATLAGAKEMGYSRVICVYQPHTYSRTAGLFNEFAAAFDNADRVLFAPIYAAREQNTFGVSSASLAERIGKKASAYPGFSTLAKVIEQEAQEEDLVLVMGAGDLYKIFDLLKLFR